MTMSMVPGDYPSDGPEVLSADAMQAADAAILQQLADAPPRRGPGRPKGSRNRPKTDEQGNFVPPGRRPKTEPPTDDEKARAERAIQEKKALAKDYERRILEANEQIFGYLIQAGISAAMFYKNGQGPSGGASSNPNWTDVANQVAIPPHLAKVAGLTAAELQSSTIGTSITSTLEGDSPLRLLVLIGATLVVGVPYLNNLNQLRKRMVAMQEAANQFNEEQARRAAATHGGGVVG